MNAAQIEALVDARVKAALAPRGWEWGDGKPECRSYSVTYTVGGSNECWTKEKALECAFSLARARGLPVIFYPWSVRGNDPVMSAPAITIRQRITGSWCNGYDRKSNYPIHEWIFSNPIKPELSQDAADGVQFIDVPEGDEHD